MEELKKEHSCLNWQIYKDPDYDRRLQAIAENEEVISFWISTTNVIASVYRLKGRNGILVILSLMNALKLTQFACSVMCRNENRQWSIFGCRCTVIATSRRNGHTLRNCLVSLRPNISIALQLYILDFRMGLATSRYRRSRIRFD